MAKVALNLNEGKKNKNKNKEEKRKKKKLAVSKNGLKGVRTIEALELLSNTRVRRKLEQVAEWSKIQSSESDFNEQTVKRNL